MQIAFSQGYTDADRAEYFFSSPYWQGFMEDSVSALALQSSSFARDYPGYDIVFYVDARTGIDTVQLRGVDIDKKRKCVGTGLILHLFHGVGQRLQLWGFDTAPLAAAAPGWIDQIVADGAMFWTPEAWE